MDEYDNRLTRLNELVYACSAMRTAQKAYFKHKRQEDMVLAKKLEKDVDNLVFWLSDPDAGSPDQQIPRELF